MPAQQNVASPIDGGLFVDVGGAAKALGTYTLTYGSTETFAGGGTAAGLAAFVAEAQGAGASIPQSAAATYAIAGDGHDMTISTQSATFSINFPYGPAPVSVTASMTFIGAQSTESVPTMLTPHDAFSSVGNLTHSFVG